MIIKFCIKTKRPIASALVLFSFLSACQTIVSAQPAVLKNDNVQTRTLLEEQFAQALGRGTVRLGAGDFTETSAIPILPPALGPYETRSPAIAIIFDLITEKGECIAIRRDTGARIVLREIKCRPRA